MRDEIIYCPNCGEDFKREPGKKGPKPRYCSRSCKDTHYNHNGRKRLQEEPDADWSDWYGPSIDPRMETEGEPDAFWGEYGDGFFIDYDPRGELKSPKKARFWDDDDLREWHSLEGESPGLDEGRTSSQRLQVIGSWARWDEA